MKKQIIISFFAVLCFIQGCDLYDVENPNVTTDKFVNSPQAASIWVNGTRAEMASTIGVIVELTELTSDNYYNNRTLSSKVFDIPQIASNDLDVNRIQSAVHALRRSAQFGLETVLPNDADSTPEHEAELRFYLGVAHLFSGEYFTALPVEALGAALTSDIHYGLAKTEFDKVIALNSTSNLVNAATLAKARIAYHENDVQTLQSLSTAIINQAPLFNYQVQFDGLNGPVNAFQNFLYDSSQDEFAPLPRLDFLDPKYFSEDGSGLDQKPISLFKIEEAYLMLAELDIVNQSLPAARTRLINLLDDVIANRPISTVNDSRETRSGGNRDDYPLSDTVQIRISPGGLLKSNLVLDRQAGDIQVPAVSGTSVTENDINNATTADELLELVFLMRQEIFISEGRRAVDLGIKYPVSDEEASNNTNIASNSTILDAVVPGFIPLDSSMDDFTVDQVQGIITISVNMNKILIDNKTSALVLPLW